MTAWTVQEAHAVILVPGQRERIAARIAPEQWGAIAREVTRR